MSEYQAPIRDMRFVIHELIGLGQINALPGFGEVSADVADAVLEEAGRFAADVLAPLNPVGDRQGTRLEDGRIRSPEGFAEAYRQFVEAGWNGISAAEAFGGMGLPELLATTTQEMWQSANTALALCPMLSAAAIEALARHGSDAQQQRYLAQLVSGQWTGTMDLTEPQAGSDLAAVRTRAEPRGDHYRLFGQKIFITWGEHEMAENIIHLVLARTPQAPAGVKGISLFIVPKFLVGADGRIGERNDLHCAGIEHKLGIHASPTCTMVYGDRDGAVGYRVGEEGRGLEYMFTMMNQARHKVGVQGLAVAERARQRALAYAEERVQGQPVGAVGAGMTIAGHPDVRRMLLDMQARAEAMRALCLTTAAGMDIARRHPDAARRSAAQARVDLLVPVVKAWCTELGVDVASTGIQVHGGMGYIEETGAAQYLRDARIAPIYEGTNGIQANDLVARKLLRDQGHAMRALIGEIEADTLTLEDTGLEPLRGALAEGVGALRQATEWVLRHGGDEPALALAAATPYLMLTGTVYGGWQMARSARVAHRALAQGTVETEFYQAKQATARFYLHNVLPEALAYARMVTTGSATVLASDGRDSDAVSPGPALP